MVIVSQLVVPEQGLIYQGHNITLKIDQTQLRPGALYISENSLHWKQNGKEDGISIPWPKISLHAVSNDPQKCIYLMLDFSLIWPGVHENVQRNGNGLNGDGDGDCDNEEDEGNVEDEDQQELTEMWLVPDDSAEVDKIYAAMTQCQTLHPDPNDSFSDDDDEDFMEALDEEFDEEDMQNLNLDDDAKYADADDAD